MKNFESPEGRVKLNEAMAAMQVIGRSVTTGMLANQMDNNRTSVGRRLQALIALGRVREVKVRASQWPHFELIDPTPFTATEAMPKKDELPIACCDERRRVQCTEAKQIGMRRDPLVAALFGQAVQS